MASSQNCSERTQLELIYKPVYKQTKKSTVIAVITTLWQNLAKFFSQYNEPKIRQHSDRHGNTWWTVYDPVTGRSASFGSTEEVVAWIEQRCSMYSRF